MAYEENIDIQYSKYCETYKAGVDRFEIKDRSKKLA